jgi:hypothetical protein
VKGSLACTNPGDVFLLLKSSDFVQHDLEHAFDLCYDHTHNTTAELNNSTTSRSDSESNSDSNSESNLDTQYVSSTSPFSLVLRKWSNLHESLEFRCIVARSNLVAICQRHCRTVFPGLQDELARVQANEEGNMRDLIVEFFDSRGK